MTTYFLDTSALVKRYVEEAGSDTVLRLCEPAARNEIVISILAEVELVSAIARRVRSNELPRVEGELVHTWFKEDLAQQYEVRMLDAAVVSAATELLKAHALRAYDAIQLASAFVSGAARLDRKLGPVIFVTADQLLGAVSESAGVPTLRM